MFGEVAVTEYTKDQLMGFVRRIMDVELRKEFFEFNNAETRSRFIDHLEPHMSLLEDDKLIEAYAVICDDSNNGDEVVNANKFAAHVYVKFDDGMFRVLRGTVGRMAIDFEESVGSLTTNTEAP